MIRVLGNRRQAEILDGEGKIQSNVIDIILELCVETWTIPNDGEQVDKCREARTVDSVCYSSSMSTITPSSSPYIVSMFVHSTTPSIMCLGQRCPLFQDPPKQHHK